MTKNRKRIALYGALFTGMFTAGALLTACGGTPSPARDVKNVPVSHPQLLKVYDNVDTHPNIAEVCIDGVAFATTSRTYGDAITRVPEWDHLCPAQ